MTLNTREILEQSSNVGAVTIGLKLGAKRFDRWVRRFGFGTPTGTDLPGEEAGIVLPLAKYSGASMGNLPIGQGLAVTPMQMAVAYSAIANGGVLRAAHIVGAVDGQPAPAAQGPPRHLRRRPPRRCGGCSRACSAPAAPPPARRSRATSWRARPAPPRSPTRSPAATRRPSTSPPSSASRPPRRRSCSSTVMVDEPKGEIYGGLVAGPAFKRITSFALSYLKIPPG